MGLVVAAAWVAVTWDVGGRTPVEHFAERARSWAVEAADAAKRRGHALLDEAWDAVADAFMGRTDAPAATPNQPGAEPAPDEPRVEPRARERVSALDRARRALPTEPASAEGASPPPPDRPPSAAQRQALERKLTE